jgi:hypothetical protein
MQEMTSQSPVHITSSAYAVVGGADYLTSECSAPIHPYTGSVGISHRIFRFGANGHFNSR